MRASRRLTRSFYWRASKASASCRARRANAAALPKSQDYRLSKSLVLIARNRTGAHIDAVLLDRSEAAVRPVLEGKLTKDDTLLCMDRDKALIAFAEAEGIEYELIIASKGEHVHEKVLHIQNVNAYGGRFKQWLNRFNGVATKYLPAARAAALIVIPPRTCAIPSMRRLADA